jgi:hypothetical protein
MRDVVSLGGEFRVFFTNKILPELSLGGILFFKSGGTLWFLFVEMDRGHTRHT